MNNDEARKELYAAHRAGYEKFVYFLMAASGACIGFALTQHKAPSGLDGELLLCALACWGGSFYFGIRAVDQLLCGYRANLDYLIEIKGLSGSSVKATKFFRQADRAHRIQISWLMLGVVIYVYSRFQEIIGNFFI